VRSSASVSVSHLSSPPELTHAIDDSSVVDTLEMEVGGVLDADEVHHLVFNIVVFILV